MKKRKPHDGILHHEHFQTQLDVFVELLVKNEFVRLSLRSEFESPRKPGDALLGGMHRLQTIELDPSTCGSLTPHELGWIRVQREELRDAGVQ